MDDFNSSDEEYGEPVKPHPKAGEKSIEKMMRSRFQDRKSTKKRVKNLADTKGSPGGVYIRTLWKNRFDSYVRMNNVSVDSTTGPSGETIQRFVETVIDHIQLRSADKPAPQMCTIRSAVINLTEAFIFQYPKFDMSRHDARRIDTVLDALAKEGKLLRGKWRKNQWLGVVIFEKIARAWLRAALEQGCLSWDVHIYKLLSIALIVALGCRTGDVALAKGYKYEFMRWKDIQLTLLRGSTLEDLEASIAICFEKSKKENTNENRVVVVRSLRQTSANVICTVKLLLIQALRSGNIKGANSLGEVLANTARRFDKTVQWANPEFPVLPAINSHSRGLMIWEKPAVGKQLYYTTLEIGLVGGVLARITAHDWRRGAAKEIANLKSKVHGVAGGTTMRALGQSRQSLGRGITDNYVGDIDEDIYTKRVEAQYNIKRGPLLGAPFKRAKLDGGEAAKEVSKAAELDTEALDESRVNTARKHLYAAQKSAWIELEKNREEPLPLPQELSTRPLRQRTPSQMNLTPVAAKNLQGEDRVVSEKSLPVPNEDHSFLGFIDPRLLLYSSDESLEDVQDLSKDDEIVATEDVQQLTKLLEDNLPEEDRDDEDRDCLGLEFFLTTLRQPKAALMF